MTHQILGLHHLTAMTSSAPKIFHFMSQILGLRLVKKTVNQDDVSAYHLYFTDDIGQIGTDMTFFEFKQLHQAQRGTDEITRTSFRIPNQQAFDYWIDRFDAFHVRHDQKVHEQFGVQYLNFYDFDDQQYALVSDEDNQGGFVQGHPWVAATVKPEYAILGLGPELMTINNENAMHLILTNVLGAELLTTDVQSNLYEFNHGGLSAQIQTQFKSNLRRSVPGFGMPHHLALAVDTTENLIWWLNRFNQIGMPHSELVNRFYFDSIYFQATPGILLELATSGPGFFTDETYEEAGHQLELPPFLNHRRQVIESQLIPFES
ncbi:VOC family protein [Weissella diestrammenae]|uniref:VOC family protein n=1 Tax=Weissella diestrammenae TaxID=1162633 RepID=UPI0019600974|nr:VOC family protein [Weissella diestrammenae]MCM0582415.1 VOC family protein [Weissella diestrammenae]